MKKNINDSSCKFKKNTNIEEKPNNQVARKQQKKKDRIKETD